MVSAVRMMAHYVRWFASPRLAWLTVIAISVALWLALWPSFGERRSIVAGTVLQLLAIYMGLRAWQSTHKIFSAPALRDEFIAFLKRRPGRNVSVGLGGNTMTMTGGALGFGSMWRPTTSDLDDKQVIEALKFNQDQLKAELTASTARFQEAITKLGDKTEQRISALENSVSTDVRTLKQAQTEGLWAALVALLFLSVGTVSWLARDLAQ